MITLILSKILTLRRYSCYTPRVQERILILTYSKQNGPKSLKPMYQKLFSLIRLFTLAVSMAATAHAQQDITRPGDPILPSSANSPAAEGVGNSIDNQSATKYLNFDSADGAEVSGFVVSPSAGASVVTGMTIQSANDAPERDPGFVLLEGSNDDSIADYNSGEWEEIAYIEEIPPFADRFQTQTFSFPNENSYKHYRWTVFGTQELNDCCFQVAEVELLGTVPAANVPLHITQQPAPLSVQSGQPARFTVTAEGTGVLNYQWFKNGNSIDGATQPAYDIPSATADDAGEYTAIVSGNGEEVQSSTVTLTVTETTGGGGNTGGGNTGSGGNTWTIMIYGHGDHNLSSSLVTDMLEMEGAGSGPGFNIVLQTDFNASDKDFAAYAVSAGIGAELHTGLTRYLVQPDSDGDSNTFNSVPVERLPESVSMDSSDTLRDFVNWSAQKYPADRYGIILWNHGGQWEGFGGDTDNGTGHGPGLSTAVIRKALKESMASNQIQKFEFAAFDTCLMGGAEVLVDFTDICDVFLANAELDYGDGLEYAGELGLLKNEPSMDIREFGRREVPVWDKHHSRGEADLALKVHAAFDLSKFNAFAQSLNLFSGELNGMLASGSTLVPRIRREVTQYNINGVSDINKPTDYIDLGEFADRLAADPSASAGLKTAAAAVSASIDGMTLAMTAGSKRAGKIHGLSIYYPFQGNGGQANYNALAFNALPDAKWNQFLTSVAESAGGDNEAPEIVSTQGLASAGLAEFGSGNPNAPSSVGRSLAGTPRILPVSPDAPVSLEFTITQGDDVFGYYAALVSNEETTDSNEYVYLGEVATARVSGKGDYSFAWDARMPVISGAPNDAQPYLGGWFTEPGSDLLVSYADYTKPGETEPTEVVLITKIDGNTGKIVQVMDSATDALSATVGFPLLAGGKLTPVYYTELRIGADQDSWDAYDVYFEDNFIIVPEGGFENIQVDLLPVFPGSYNIELLATDNFDNESGILTYQLNALTDEFFTSGEPALKVARGAAGDIQVSWETNDGFILQRSPSVIGSWTPVDPGQIKVDAAQNATFAAPIAGNTQFFRLIKNP
ncbi:MAG: clostripain-related cysteine peptidase [Verrucomicrobia bacterium]|nr:clostripain-related cysteine peptidase [Verrucomicrobiota bacterium]